MIKKYRQYRQVIEYSVEIREPVNMADKEMEKHVSALLQVFLDNPGLITGYYRHNAMAEIKEIPMTPAVKKEFDTLPGRSDKLLLHEAAAMLPDESKEYVKHVLEQSLENTMNEQCYQFLEVVDSMLSDLKIIHFEFDEKETAACTIIYLLNPQDFAISFAGIAYDDDNQRFLLSTFVNREVAQTFSFDSLEKAKGHFFTTYSELIQEKRIRPSWSTTPVRPDTINETTEFYHHISSLANTTAKKPKKKRPVR